MCSVDEPGTTVDARLTDLIGRGYRFLHPRDEHGRVVAVVGVRAHDRVVDVVLLNAEDDVSAYRVAGDEGRQVPRRRPRRWP